MSKSVKSFDLEVLNKTSLPSSLNVVCVHIISRDYRDVMQKADQFVNDLRFYGHIF